MLLSIRAGEPLEKVDGVTLLHAPPIAVLMDQQLIEKETKRADGEKVKTSYIEQELLAVACSATAEALTLYPIDISVHLDTPIAGKVPILIATACERYPKLNCHFKLPVVWPPLWCS